MSELAGRQAGDLAGVIWRKSSYTASNGQCVEVADLPGAGGVAVRDSKYVEHGAARVSGPCWAAFLSALRDGDLT